MNQHRRCLINLALIVSSIYTLGYCAESEQHVCRYCSEEASQWAALDAKDHNDNVRKYAPDRYVDVLHLKLDVTPDFQKRTVAGTATIEFTPVGKPLHELRLDAVHLNIHDLRSTVPVADTTATTEHLTITFSSPIPPGERCRLDIDYSAEPKQGLYFRTAELGYPAGDTHLYTQGEPQLASHWFPCHDYPNERSSTEIICHVPKDMTVLSNGVLVSETMDAATGKKAVRWRQEKPHVCYLITLVAGYFSKLEDAHRDIPLAFYAQPSAGQHAANSFRDTADIMAFYEKEIGVPFPWNKYYQVTVHDFGYGGMENTSMTTLTHRTIFTNETENIRTTRELDAHEMAHQWFGDYVTCKDWSHLWLNEGFATYYAHLYEGHKFGRDAMLYGIYNDAADRVLPKHKDRRPIVYNRYNYPMEQFDFRAYPKGSWILHMLRSQLGKDLYRQCIRTYLEQHALTSVTTSDLVNVIEDQSGRSMDRFFDQWVYHARHPSLKIEYEWLAAKKLAHVTIEQTQSTDDEVLLFELSTMLRFQIGQQTVDHSIKIDQSKHDFYVSLPEQPSIVRFDPGYTVLADVEFEKPDKMLLAQLKNDQDMIGRIFAVHQLAKRKTSEAIGAIGLALREDPFHGVRIEAAKALVKVHNDEALAELAKATDADDARVRLQVITSIGESINSQAKALLIEVVQQDKNPAITANAIRSLGKYRDAQVEQIITKMLQSNSFRNELAEAAIEALGKNEDATQRDALMNALRLRESELTSYGLGNGLKTLAKVSRSLNTESAGRTEVERFLRDYALHPKPPVRNQAVEALGILGDNRSIEILESIANEKPSGRAARVAVKSLKKIRGKASAVPQELTDLRKLIDELRDDTKKLREEVDQLNAEHEDEEEPAEQ